MKGLKKFRTENGWTQAQLAKLLGVRQGAIVFWETGKRFPKKENFDKLTQLFGCTIDQLL